MPVVFVRLDQIEDNPFQSRKYYAPHKTEELADTIEQVGLVQTPKGRLVNQRGEGLGLNAATQAAYAGGDVPPQWRVQLAVGHRRLRAHREIADRGAADQVGRSAKGTPAGCMAVDVQPLTDAEMADFEVVENDQREGLSDVEKAEGWEARQRAFGLTQDEIAERYGYKDRASVANIMRLLRLPEEVRQMNRDGRLVGSKARALVPLYTTAEKHPDEVEAYEARDRALTRAGIVEKAAEGQSAEAVALNVDVWKGMVLAEVERRERERNPALFEETPATATSAATGGQTADEAPENVHPEPTPETPSEPVVETPTAEAPDVSTSAETLTLGEVAREVQQIYAVYVSADDWRRDNVQPEDVDVATIERTVRKLKGAEADVARLRARVEAAGLDPERVGSGGRTVAFTQERIRAELKTYTEVLDRRRARAGVDQGTASAPDVVRAEPAQAAPVGRFSVDVDDFASETAELIQEAPAPVPPAWPVPVLDGVLVDLEKRTKKLIVEVDDARHVPLTRPEGVQESSWGGDITSISEGYKKDTILTFVRMRIRFEANLACAMALTDAQVDEVDAFLVEALSTPGPVGPRRLEMQHGRRAVGNWRSMLRTLDVVPMDDGGRRHYRRGEVRRLLATCYDTVRAEMVKREKAAARADKKAAAVEAPAADDLGPDGEPVELCEHCGEMECDRTCVAAMAEDGLFDEPVSADTPADETDDEVLARIAAEHDVDPQLMRDLVGVQKTHDGKATSTSARKDVAAVIEAAAAGPPPELTSDQKVEAVLAGDHSHVATLSDGALQVALAQARAANNKPAEAAVTVERRARFEAWQRGESEAPPAPIAPAADGRHTAETKAAIAAGDDPHLILRALRVAQDAARVSFQSARDQHSSYSAEHAERDRERLADLGRAVQLVTNEISKRAAAGDGADVEAQPAEGPAAGA